MIKRIQNRIRKTGFLSLFSNLVTHIKACFFNPKVVVNKASGIEPISLGSEYGKKRLFDFDELIGSQIISCGLGEDASFDVEFAARYRAKVIICDPTPRAIKHYNNVIRRIGMEPEKTTSDYGAHDIEAYDLSGLNLRQLSLEKFALWTREESLRFFAPKNPSHVSYSITNFQHEYNTDPQYEHIEVDTITLPSLIKKYNILQLPFLKLDIEGAEIEVLKDMLAQKIYPTQIAVEFDGLNFPSAKGRVDCLTIDSLLRKHGYLCYDFDGVADFLYVISARVDLELSK